VFQGMFSNGVFGNQKLGLAWIAILILIAAFLPNTQQFMRRYRPAFETYHGEIQRLRYRWLEWRPVSLYGILIGFCLTITLLSMTIVESEFLYFQF